MLSTLQQQLMNVPVFDRTGHCSSFRRNVLRNDVAEMVLELVHPNNLGELPPSPDVIAWKAVQIGLLKSMNQAYSPRRVGQFN